MNIYLKLLIALVVGVIIGSLLTCGNEKVAEVVVERSSDTVVKFITKVKLDTLRRDNIKVVYRDSKLNTIEGREDMKELVVDSTKLAYEYNDVLFSDDESIKVDYKITGWGGINSFESKFSLIQQDKIVEVNNLEKTKETILKTPNQLFLGGSYQFSGEDIKSNVRANIDWNIKNKVILGGSVGLDGSLGVKVGIGIK